MAGQPDRPGFAAGGSDATNACLSTPRRDRVPVQTGGLPLPWYIGDEAAWVGGRTDPLSYPVTVTERSMIVPAAERARSGHQHTRDKLCAGDTSR